MKKLLLFCIIFILALSVYAQKVDVGLKGGINYNSNGELRQFGGFGGLDTLFSSDKKIGYHGGFYFQLNFNKLYLRPEFVYSKTRSSYNGANYDIRKIDGNLLVGLDVLGPLHIFVGPSVQHILDSELGPIVLEPEHNINLGMDFGLGLDFGQFGADVRYERGLTRNEAAFVNDIIADEFEYEVDTRPKQMIISFYYRLNNSQERD